MIVNGNCTIKGNLNVLRTPTEIKSSEVVIDDNIITLNKYDPHRHGRNKTVVLKYFVVALNQTLSLSGMKCRQVENRLEGSLQNLDTGLTGMIL